MKKIKGLVLKPYVLFFSFACLLILLSSFKLGVFQAHTNVKQADFPVTSLIPGVTIVEARVQKDSVLISLRNDSNKTITAFSWSSSDVIYNTEMVGSDNTMAPGSIKNKLCGLPSPASQKPGITILAVVYDDGTSDGDPNFVNEIFDERAGTQAQIERILPLFKEILTTPKNMRLLQKREAIKAQLEQLPAEEEIDKSLAFRRGLHNEKERAINNLKQMEQFEQERGEDAARKALPRYVENYETRILVFSKSLKRA